MHLAEAFIQSDLHCISRKALKFLSVLAFPGNQTHDLGIASTNALLFEQQERLKKNRNMYSAIFLR